MTVKELLDKLSKWPGHYELLIETPHGEFEVTDAYEAEYENFGTGECYTRVVIY